MYDRIGIFGPSPSQCLDFQQILLPETELLEEKNEKQSIWIKVKYMPEYGVRLHQKYG